MLERNGSDIKNVTDRLVLLNTEQWPYVCYRYLNMDILTHETNFVVEQEALLNITC